MKHNFSVLFLIYLKTFAKIQLAKIKLIQYFKKQPLNIIGITGSTGKSTLISICESALKPNFKIKTSQNYNSESGLPLSILDIKINDYNFIAWLKILILCPFKLITNWQNYQILILEMGVDSPVYPKNMDFLLSIVKPNIAIFLNVTPVHLFNYKNIDEIAKEKVKLVNQANFAIINSSDSLVKKYTSNKNTINIIPISISIPKSIMPPIYNISFGAAIALGNILGLEKSICIKNIQTNFILPPSRSSIFKGINNSTIIDSSYNSSPLACQEMLTFLDTFPSPKIAILGDMRELGNNSATEHQKIYKKAITIADSIISIGPQTTKYFGNKAKKFFYWWQAIDYLKNNIPQKSTILVKGSQNTIYLEELIKSILNNPSDSQKLCRQHPYWLKTKQNFQKKSNP